MHPGLFFRFRGQSPYANDAEGLLIFTIGFEVFPGDIIVADDDGSVVIPLKLVDGLLEKAGSHKEWEEFTKMKLLEGGDLRKYYPLNEEAQIENELWLKNKPDH